MLYLGAEYNFPVTQGNTYDQTLTFSDGTAPLDWTGWTASLQIRREATDLNPPYVSLTETDGLTLGGADGTIRIRLTPTQTQGLAYYLCPYELKVTDPTGDVSTLLYGVIQVKAAVVHP